MARRTELESALYWLGVERKFFAEHGGTLLSYVVRYGSASAPDHYGDGGEAIYAADLAALRKAEQRVIALVGRKR